MSAVGWQQTGSNGEEFGDRAAVAHAKQRAIAMDALERCESSFILIVDEDNDLRCVSVIRQKNVDVEELTEYGREFLRQAALGIVNVMDNFTTDTEETP